MGVDAATLRQRLGDAAAFAERVAASLQVEDFGQEHFSPQHNRHYSAAWCMFPLDHLAVTNRLTLNCWASLSGMYPSTLIHCGEFYILH